ncbi:MAG: DNA polymerase IV [Treponema sp.]
MNNPLFFHVDIDAFYSSVEVLDNPSYKDKPVIVGGLNRRGVVSTCSYQARAFGIRAGMPMYEAKKKCPKGIFLKCRMSRYKEKSNEVMDILKNYTPYFQQISIDEAFLDMTGMERLLGSPLVQANRIKKDICSKTGITVSIGGGSNKYIAKMASSTSKPDGLLIVPNGNELDFMRQFPLNKVWGLGKSAVAKLNSLNIFSVDDVLSIDKLELMFTPSFAKFLYKAVRGKADDVFKMRKKVKSISTEHTFDFDENALDVFDDLLFKQATEIMNRLIRNNIVAKTISVKIHYSNFSKKIFSETGSKIISIKDLYHRVKKLFLKTYDGNKVRLLGIGVSNIENVHVQNDLFILDKDAKLNQIEKAIVNLKDNDKNIISARLLKAHDD